MYQICPEMKSRIFYLGGVDSTNHLEYLCKIFCSDVLRLPISDTDGIPLVVEGPMCNYPKVNLERPEETRIYYGREIYRKNGKSWRYSYASKHQKGNTGKDPRDYGKIMFKVLKISIHYNYI